MAIEQKEAEVKLEERKWSTFLQKPQGPRPAPKKEQDQAPKAPPYRVKIVKQKKKSEIEAEQIVANDADEEKAAEVVQDGEPVPPEAEEDLEEELEQQEHIEYYNLEHLQDEEEAEVEGEEEVEEREEEEEEDKQEAVPSLQQQLELIQSQLLALSNLPVEAQATLESVTQQLARLVQANSPRPETKDEQEDQEEEEAEEPEEQISDGDDQEEELHSLEDTVESEAREEFDEEYEAEVERRYEQDLSDVNPTEEDIEAARADIERAEKLHREDDDSLQRRLEHRPTNPLTPHTKLRPIILPGGRRWSNADDASRSARKPKMSDEKICATIETYSEVNEWNDLWPWSNQIKSIYRINFLKYTPAPKNMDYLQRSEVFRMLHETEEPKRGIAARPGKIAAEEDYYQDGGISLSLGRQ